MICSYLSKANYFILLLGFFCFIAYFFLRGYVWQLLLKAKNYNLSFREVLYFWEISEFKRYIPGNIWSFIGRGVSFTDLKVKKNDIVHSLVVEAVLIIISSITVSLLSMQFLIGPLHLLYENTIYIAFFLLVICLNLIFVYSSLLKGKVKNRIVSYFLNEFPAEVNIRLLFISLLSFFFFGLGSFFVTFAFFGLDLNLVFVLTGFFCLALIAGYLSFITPMGLGVREGIIVYGLSHLVSVSIAGSASILARIFLIATETVFLVLTLIFYSIRSAVIEKAYRLLARYKTELILSLLTVLYNAYFIPASVLRYEKYYAGRFDLGNMDQVVWNTMNGRIFQMTDPNGINSTSRLAFHADFILILFAPLYYIWSDARMLLVAQTIILSLGAIFMFLIAKKVIKNKQLALLFSFIYLINPALNYTNLYDFHPVTLGTTFLLGTFYFLIRKRYLWFIIFAILAGITKEHVWLIVGLLGLYAFIKGFINKEKDFSRFIGPLLFLGGMLIFYILIWYAIPLAKGGNHFALTYYSEFGDSPSSIIKNIVLSPIGTIQKSFQPSQIIYLTQLFLPLGFLSLFSPLMLIFALPDLGINLLSNNEQLHQIYYQYSSTITPFIFISAIYSSKLLIQKSAKFSKIIFAYLAISSIYGAYLYGPLPGTKAPNLNMFTVNLENKNIIDNFIVNIPNEYSIAATNNIGSHLTHRQKLYTIPVGIGDADMIIFLLNDPYAQPSLAAQIEIAKQMENNKNYVQIFKNGDFVVFKPR
ncbi:MAG: DUF2079 domain-containing protein [Actinobacteria bacterium]|nr:DUF2079 domain-containing protein [Actinomycetota bacterium]